MKAVNEIKLSEQEIDEINTLELGLRAYDSKHWDGWNNIPVFN